MKTFEYIITNFRLIYNYKDVDISYNAIESKNNRVNILKSSYFEPNKRVNVKKVIWKKWKNIEIPFCFDTIDKGEIITYKNNKATINYDIISSAFYLLSGLDEYNNKKKDKLGRVSYEDSLIKNLGIIGLPIVNYYFDILYEAIKHNHEITKKKHWGSFEMGVSLTHDIDKLYSGWKEDTFSELKKIRLKSAIKIIFNRIFKKDSWFNLEKIVEIEKSKGANSTFYFLPSKEKVELIKNADYSIDSTEIKNLIKTLESEGNEIGVHGSFGSHLNLGQFTDEISKINTENVIGNRFHYLMYCPKSTTTILEEANIKYDSTIGFAEKIGFRRSYCFPFFLYNFDKNQISPVIEIPLIVMDTTLREKKYMNLSSTDSMIEIEKIIKEIHKFNGALTILWHNNYFSEYKYHGWKELYINILNLCKRYNGKLSSCKETLKCINEQEN